MVVNGVRPASPVSRLMAIDENGWEACPRIVLSSSTFSNAYLYLGTTLRRLARNSEALPFLEQAVKRDPKYILAYNELASAQIEAGKPEDALRTLQEGERRFPEEATFPAQLAGLLRRLGRTLEAKSEGEKATRLSKRNNPIKHGIAAGPIAGWLASPAVLTKLLGGETTGPR